MQLNHPKSIAADTVKFEKKIASDHSEVATAMRQLQDAISQINARANVLIERLDPVLKPESAALVDSAAYMAEERERQAPIVEQVINAANAIESLAARVESVLQRLAV